MSTEIKRIVLDNGKWLQVVDLQSPIYGGRWLIVVRDPRRPDDDVSLIMDDDRDEAIKQAKILASELCLGNE